MGRAGGISAVELTPDGRLAVCAAEDASVRCWRVDTGTCAHTMLGHRGWVVAVAITADSGTALSASHDATVRCVVLGKWRHRAHSAAPACMPALPCLHL